MKKSSNLFSALFLAPSFIIYTLLVIFSLLMTVYFGFTDWDGIGARAFIWFQNYTDMFTDPQYWIVVKNTVVVVMLTLLIQMPIGFILAYLVWRLNKGALKLFRSLYFIPVVISAAAVAVMFASLMNDDVGAINMLLEKVGLGFLRRQWLSDVRVVLFSVALPQIWQYIGIDFIIFLAAMQALPEEVIESARIDGANSFQILFRIVLPMLWNVIQLVIILSVTGSFKSFDQAWIMTWGGPGVASSYIAVLMYRSLFREFRVGYGSAIAVSILAYSLVFTLLFRFFVGLRERKD